MKILKGSAEAKPQLVFFVNKKGDTMTKLSPAEENKRQMKIHATNFDLKTAGIRDLRKIVRASVALCKRVELCGVPNVRAKDLYVSLNPDGLFTYEYHYAHEDVPLQDTYTQKTLDNLASKYKNKI